MNVSAEWQTIFADGTAELDNRYAMETHDDAVIEIINSGFRHGPPDVIAALAKGKSVDPDSYYMRAHARIETGDPRYEWVNCLLFIETGARQKTGGKVELFLDFVGA
ncbi:DUF3237 family protein [uncultured Pelagimonas sp.]|uniref:DUF3237 family protein n=1 Tax=uncultured Pelagimonas sp. TaxID=1618102 RepID=UPI002605E23F|nr:DUF3237 family protein [uncultured Pelagimonas sp.]